MYHINSLLITHHLIISISIHLNCYFLVATPTTGHSHFSNFYLLTFYTL